MPIVWGQADHGRKSRRRRLATAPALLLCVAALAACGGGDSDAGTPSAVPAGIRSTPAAPDYSASGPRGAADLEGAVDRSLIREDAPPDSRFLSPVEDATLREGGQFGADRDGGLVHGGLDLLSAGPVLAPCSGTVALDASDDRLGRHLWIDCGDGWAARIGFLGGVLLEAGDSMEVGDEIARVDSTLGFVHLQIELDGQLVDPSPYVFGGRPAAPDAETMESASPAATAAATATPTEPVTSAVPTNEATAAQTVLAATMTPTRTATSVPTPTTVPPTPTPTRAPPTVTPTPTPRPIIR